MIIVSFGGCGRLPILLFFFQNILFDIYREKEEQLKLILSYSLKLFHIYIYISKKIHPILYSTPNATFVGFL